VLCVTVVADKKAGVTRCDAGLDPPISASTQLAGHLIFLWQKDGGDGAVRLSDDPDALVSYRVEADYAPAVY
jgi:hypothetical protein